MGYMDRIPVVRGHLESVREALEAGLALGGAQDLVDAARTVGASHRQSRFTALMEQNLAHINGYLSEDGDELPEN